MLYDWVYGISQIAAVVLSCIAGIIALSIFKDARKQELLRAWKPMVAALVLFAVEELLGLFRTFDVYGTAALSWLPSGLVKFLTVSATHIVPFFILLFLIAALITQINIKRGWVA
tara:strand:- start:584 stop:928 length:345 start_codon:yes stop_codon:yes gene_type:complete